MIIKDRLKIIQNLSGLTQEELAKKLGVSFATFNSWINERSKATQKGNGKYKRTLFIYTGQKDVPKDPLNGKRDR